LPPEIATMRTAQLPAFGPVHCDSAKNGTSYSRDWFAGTTTGTLAPGRLTQLVALVVVGTLLVRLSTLIWAPPLSDVSTAAAVAARAPLRRSAPMTAPSFLRVRCFTFSSLCLAGCG
jgi:hypothetical protein